MACTVVRSASKMELGPRIPYTLVRSMTPEISRLPLNRPISTEEAAVLGAAFQRAPKIPDAASHLVSTIASLRVVSRCGCGRQCRFREAWRPAPFWHRRRWCGNHSFRWRSRSAGLGERRRDLRGLKSMIWAQEMMTSSYLCRIPFMAGSRKDLTRP